MTQLHGVTMPRRHGYSELRDLTRASLGSPFALLRREQWEALMPKRSLLAVMLAVGATGLSITGAVAGEVNVGVNIGIPVPPPPRIVLSAPPPVVVVPHSPVSYVPSVNFNLFVYGGRYYTFHDGAWFHARSHSGPWVFIATERVPRPVVAVPVTYYKIPPGHAKKMERRAAAPAGPASEGWCPPGQAKKGRC
jgi:hypothetical protein